MVRFQLHHLHHARSRNRDDGNIGALGQAFEIWINATFDGRLDVVTIGPGPRLNLVGLGLRMLTSDLSRADGARHQLAAEIRLSADGTVPVQLDGEPAGVLPISVRVQPGAVRLLLT